MAPTRASRTTRPPDGFTGVARICKAFRTVGTSELASGPDPGPWAPRTQPSATSCRVLPFTHLRSLTCAWEKTSIARAASTVMRMGGIM